VFSVTKELEKTKIQVPLTELVKTPAYQREITEFINISQNVNINDIVNLQEDKPVVGFSHVEEVNSSTIPFYISLLVHDLLLHNCMFDFGTSHNLMPLSVMKQLNLQVTKPYKDLYSFDSHKVKCLGGIKDVLVSLAHIPAKSLEMDIVVANIPARFGMLLSKSWGAKLCGVLKLDFSYVVIPIFGGEERGIYRETSFLRKITNNEASNSPVYSQEKDDLSCFMLDDNAELAEDNQRQLTSACVNKELQIEGVWKCVLDGAYSNERTGVSQDEDLQAQQLGVGHREENQQVGNVGQQYVKPFIIANEDILGKKKDDKEIVYHYIEEHNDAYGSKVNNLFEFGHMSCSDVKIFLFLLEVIITNYFQ